MSDFMMIGPREHSQKCVTNRRTDALTHVSNSKSAMVADKNVLVWMSELRKEVEEVTEGVKGVGVRKRKKRINHSCC